MNYRDWNDLTLKELISMTLRESNNSPVVEELLQRFTSLRGLSEATVNELVTIKGLGPRKASLLKASFELGKRLYCTKPEKPVSIRSPQDVADLVMPEMRYLDREHFRALLLNTKNHIIRVETISIGTLNTSTIHPRELFKPAIRFSAASIILVHNHPSGDSTPSREDIDVTRRLVEVGRILGIEVLDHVIIGDGVFTSFKEKGLLEAETS